MKKPLILMEGLNSHFSPTLLKYVDEHLVTPALDRFRLHCVTWIDASILKRIEGNPLREDKLQKVKAWLCNPNDQGLLDVVDKEGHWIGLPTVSIDCVTKKLKLEEGNHRVHILIEEKGVKQIPVEVVFKEGCSSLEEEQDFFHNKLLTILHENNLNHSGFWSRKEVWRACAYTVIQSLFHSDSDSDKREVRPKKFRIIE
jgi:hypothetical protein